MSDDKNSYFELGKQIIKLREKTDDTQNNGWKNLNYEKLLNSFKPEHKELFQKLGELKTRCRKNLGTANISNEELQFLKTNSTQEFELRCLNFGSGLCVELKDNKISRIVDKYHLIQGMEDGIGYNGSLITRVRIELSKGSQKLYNICKLLRERKNGAYNEEELILNLMPYVKEDVKVKRICLPYYVSVDLLDDTKVKIIDLFHAVELYNEEYLKNLNNKEKHEDCFEKE